METMKAHAQPITQIRITLLDNGNLTISGMPQDTKTALVILSELNRAVFEHFIKLAKSGQLDDNNTIIQKHIISPEQLLAKAI